ncbi:MAG: rhombosortase [Desulfobacterales bacterium S5133MH4]|nr:MAG: rhombosortase [Desulfobacterales bacterium S5133MH4]
MKPLSRTENMTDRLPEFLGFSLIILFLNCPLIWGHHFDTMVFLPESVKTGQWWRIISHPFVHLTWYHLLLDAGAFLLLYHGLKEQHRLMRILYVIACGAGSLLTSLWMSPVVSAQGLCGLSGIAHGLMAVSALEEMENKSHDRRDGLIGAVMFAVVVGKCVVEVVNDQVLFQFLHFGMMGHPVATCHAGGVLAGIITFLICHHQNKGCLYKLGHRPEFKACFWS